MDLRQQNLVFIIHFQPSMARNYIVDTLLSLLLAYEGVSTSFRAGRLERELQMVQLSATGCSYIAIL
jgi:hypothetical protein